MSNESKTGVLGGGISALSFAYFYEEELDIFEKEKFLGGLCRSFHDEDGVPWDIGPHITFSKNKEILDFITSIVPMNKLKRLNRIYHDGEFIKYPFENHLYALSEKEKEYCLNTFLDNPYENFESSNMLEFFYQTFGEGITRLFLEPYNRKIWKYEPSFLDKQMVERIPKPPPEDIINSAKGIGSEGYLHQLYFHYPKSGGFQSIVDNLEKMITANININLNSPVEKIKQNKNGKLTISSKNNKYNYDKLISTIPIHETINLLEEEPPKEVMEALNKLKYNSIHITCIKVKGDYLDDNFAITFADPKLIFHRISKLNFLGNNYYEDGYTNLMVEVTYRPGLQEDISHSELERTILNDLENSKLIDTSKIENIFTNSFKYAYVIYDKGHRKNTDIVLNYLKSINIEPLGRFGTFEYINSDKAIELAKDLAMESKK